MTEEWVTGLSGATDYHIPFFNGFGEGNMGEISNRPLIYDQSGYPMKVSYAPAEGPLSYFSNIEELPEGTEAGTVKKDFILRGSLDINNEVVEIISVPEEVTEHAMNFGEAPPKPGEYHIIMNAVFNFELVDSSTGKAVINDVAKGGFTIDNRDVVDVLLPVKNGDAKAFERYFAGTDFTPYAIEAAKKCMTRFYHLMSPFYTTSSYTVKKE